MADNSNYTRKATATVMTAEEVEAAVNGRAITNEIVNLAELALADALAASDSEQQQLYATYRKYYDGEVGFELTDRMKEFFELEGNVSYSFNFIPLAIDTIQERLAIDYFEVAGEDEDTPEDKRQGGENGRLMDWFDFNRMDAGQDDVHHDTLVDGDAYVIIDWDDKAKMPIIATHPAYVSTFNDGTSDGVWVAYKEENQKEIKFAVRSWRIETGADKGHTRLNVYTDDALYKYITGGAGYVPYQQPGFDWPIPWVDKQGQPLGVPVAAFGIRSSLVGDVITFQDAINKNAVDEMAGADIEAFQIITLSGGAAPVDEDGNSTVEIGPRRVLHAPDGQWGSIGAGDLAGLAMMTDKAIQRLAQRRRISLKYFQITGQVSSADSQNADDSGMVSQIEGIARRVGNSWEDVMRIARNVHNAFCDSGEELDDGRISAVWKSFERINRQESDKVAAETNETKARTFDSLLMNKVDRLTAAKRAGYTDEEAAEMAAVVRPDLDGGITQ